MKKQSQPTGTTPIQALDAIKQHIENLPNVNMAEMPNRVQALTQAVEQLEVQVRQLEGMRAQLNEMTSGQAADDGSQQNQNNTQQQGQPQWRRKNQPAWWQKLWGQIEQTLAPEWKPDDTPNQVAGVRGSFKSELTAGKKKKTEHSAPRGKKENKDLPEFWRRNMDYGESPYMNLDKIEKITDKPPFSKRDKKKKKASVDAPGEARKYFEGGFYKGPEEDELPRVTRQLAEILVKDRAGGGADIYFEKELFNDPRLLDLAPLAASNVIEFRDVYDDERLRANNSREVEESLKILEDRIRMTDEYYDKIRETRDPEEKLRMRQEMEQESYKKFDEMMGGK